jgi:hypothetical protein
MAKKLEKAKNKGKGGKNKKKQRPNVEMRNLLNQTPPPALHMTSHMTMDGAIPGATAMPMDSRGRHHAAEYDARPYADQFEPHLQATPYPDRNAESPNHVIIDTLQRKNSVGTQTPGMSRSPGISRSPVTPMTPGTSKSPGMSRSPGVPRSPHDYPVPNAYFEPIPGSIDRYVSLTHPESPLPALRATEIPSLRAGEGTPQKIPITVTIERPCSPVYSRVSTGTSTSFSEETPPASDSHPRAKVTRSNSARDNLNRTPSPRPDTIQDGVYTYTTAPHCHSNHLPNHERKLSLPDIKEACHTGGKKSPGNQAQPV